MFVSTSKTFSGLKRFVFSSVFSFYLALALGLCCPSAAPAASIPLELHTAPTGGALDWSRSWMDKLPVGIPALAVECESAGSGGDLSCTNGGAPLVPTKIGTPTTVEAYGTPARTAVSLNGVDQAFSLGDVGDADGNITACVGFKPDVAATGNVISKDAVVPTAARHWGHDYTGGGRFYIFDVNGNQSGVQSVPTAGAPNIACFSYLYVADNTSELRSNTNGVAANVTNARGPIGNSAAALQIGRRAYDISPAWFDGDVFYVAIWPTGWAASAAQLAVLTAHLQARLTTRPRDGLVTVTSAASLCNPSGTATGTLYQIPANNLCCGASGCAILPAVMHENRVVSSSNLTSGWTQRAGNPITLTYNATGGPANGPYTNLVGVGASTVADIYTTNTIGFTNNGFVGMGFYIRKGSASGTLTLWNAAVGGGVLGLWSINFTSLGSGWEWVTAEHPAVTATTAFKATATGACGVWFSVASGTLDFDVSLVTQQDSALLGVPVYTAGAVVAGTADQPGLSSQVYTNTWALGVRAKPIASMSWDYPINKGLLGNGTGTSAGTFYWMLNTGGALVWSVADGSASRVFTGTALVTDSDEHKFAVVYDTSPSVTFYIDGVASSGTWSGAGTGISSGITGTIYPGSVNPTNSVYPLRGDISRVCQGTGPSAYDIVAACLR